MCPCKNGATNKQNNGVGVGVGSGCLQIGNKWQNNNNNKQIKTKTKKAWRIEAIMQDVLGTLKGKMVLQPNTLKEAKEGGGVEGINH